MLSIDRKNYAPRSEGEDSAYEDRPLPIGYKATISAPHMHAHALCLLADHLKTGAHALDVGCGSGYLCACMAEMVGPEGRIIGIDYLTELVQLAIGNIKQADDRLFVSGQLVVQQGDGWQGFPPEAPFDCIHVGAA